MGDLTGHETLNVVCDNCGLLESSHVFAGGTRVKNTAGSYICDGYSQRKLLTGKQWALQNKKAILND